MWLNPLLPALLTVHGRMDLGLMVPGLPGHMDHTQGVRR